MAKIRTYDGRLVDPLNITAPDVIPWVLMRSICQLNRFTGHAAHPYSVGQHTMNLLTVVPKHLHKAALIHDWQEAWFNDMSSPLKAEMPEYKLAEQRAGKRVATVMGVSVAELEEFDQYDKAIYINERDHMFPVLSELGMGDDRVGLNMPAYADFGELHWKVVYNRLMYMYGEIFKEWINDNINNSPR